MGDPVVSGFIGAGIDNKTTLILHHISINGVSCTEELESLKNLVIRIQPIITQIQQYRPTLNRNNGICTSQCFNQASTVSSWLRKLDVLLRQALEVVERCAIPKYKVFSRYQSSRRITRLISDIERHMALSPLALLALIPELTKERMQTISEPLIVGQDKAFSRLEQLVIDAEFSRIGVVGKDGSGKSLLLKRVFNSKAVRDNFSDGLLLWLTVSKSPSFTSLRSDLCSQITRQTNGDMVKDMNEETVKLWLNVNMKEQRFALFLDDLWEEGAKLLEELSVVGHSGSKIIVSSRDRSVLLEIGVNAETSTIKMEDLIEDDSWRLFTFHAFPYNDGHLSASVDDETARLVCAKCEGLPLAIKAVGRVMAGIADAKEWELAVRKLLTANSQERQAVYDILRFVYDALGRDDVNLQLCFLYIAAAFPESQVVDVERQVLPLWVGEGFLRTRKPQYLPEGHNPFELGRNYVKILADRCLIESTVRDIDGRVLYFRMHDMLRDLGKEIVEHEENFYCRVDPHLNENKCSGHTRIVLMDNKLSSLPKSLRLAEILSLLTDGNPEIEEIPRKMISSMDRLQVLDLSSTSVTSLPESVACLKQLVCLRLVGVPMTMLPASVTKLRRLEILDVSNSEITELPHDIHKLKSLTYLCLSGCEDLQCLPRSISRLTSLQYLNMFNCYALYRKGDLKKRRKKLASVDDLRGLTQLKTLNLQNHGETIDSGILGRLLQMETLDLTLTMMEGLPDDMTQMLKLRSLRLDCFHVINMGINFGEFQNLSKLQLRDCLMLEEIPYLCMLRCLRQLEIIGCRNLKKLPQTFGAVAAIPLLEIFSLAFLDKLEELPSIEEGALPLLEIFTMIGCTKISRLPDNYLILKTLRKIRVYGCLENSIRENTKIEIIAKSDTDVYLNKHYQGCDEKENWLYSEF